MGNYPAIASEIQQLRMYKEKNGYTDAVLATAMTAFGWTWLEDHVAALFAGRKKPTATEQIFIRLFLLQKFYDYNCS